MRQATLRRTRTAITSAMATIFHEKDEGVNSAHTDQDADQACIQKSSSEENIEIGIDSLLNEANDIVELKNSLMTEVDKGDAELKVGSTGAQDSDVESEADNIEHRRDIKITRSPLIRKVGTGEKGSQGGFRNFDQQSITCLTVHRQSTGDSRQRY